MAAVPSLPIGLLLKRHRMVAWLTQEELAAQATSARRNGQPGQNLAPGDAPSDSLRGNC